MNIFVNISHPAHVHFFKNALKILTKKGHYIIIGARNKEFVIDLLKAYKMKHVVLTDKGRGVFGLGKEMYNVSEFVSNFLLEVEAKYGSLLVSPHPGIPLRK